MKSNKIRIIVLFIFFFFHCSKLIFTQVSPLYDENWELVELKSDEFDQETLNTNMWLNPPPCAWNSLGCYYWAPSNVKIEDDELVLTAKLYDSEHKPYYSSGGIQSINRDYTYGYFEIYSKLPGDYIDDEPSGEGFWPAFWTYFQDVGDPPEKNCVLIHDEIDIVEPDGCQYANADWNEVGWHDTTFEKPCVDPNKFGTKKKGHFSFFSSEPLFLDYHKYTVEWLSDRIIYYFDDKPFYARYDDPSMIMDNQFVVIDLQIDGYMSFPIIKVPLPNEWRVKYFHYYQLKKDCNADAIISNNSELSSFYFAVKRNIILGDGSSLIYLNTGDNKTFRATNSILINGDFTVPTGCELNLIPTPCD